MEPIALVAHADRARAYEALAHITVHADEKPAVLTIDASLAAAAPMHGDDNVFKHIAIDRGDVDAAMASADLVVEGEYQVPHQEQAYIENNGVIAWLEDDGTVVVMGSMQCPYYVHKALKAMLRAARRARARRADRRPAAGSAARKSTRTMIAGHAAILARKSGRPVQDDLRPARGHGGDDEAPSGARSAIVPA